MAPSACDQKKAEIVRHAEIQCSAEVNQAKATYELKCLELKKSYEARKNRACRDLEKQELEELGEIKRLYEAELEPIKAKHAEKLSAIREQYRIATPEAGLHASAISETPSSPTLVAVPQRLADQQQAEAGNKDTAPSNRSIDDTQESGDETDTSIPAFTNEVKSKPTFSSYLERRKRRYPIFDSDDEESGFSQNANEDGQDGDSDFPSGRAFKASKGVSAQRIGQNSVSSASQTKTKNRPRQDELTETLETRSEATPTSLQIDGQAEGGDEDEAIYDGPASQAPRRNHVRPGRPKPGKYRMNAKAWPV